MFNHKLFIWICMVMTAILIKFVNTQPQIIKSSQTNGYSIYHKDIDVSSTSYTYTIQFYIWIVPLAGNSLINKMQIARISTQKMLTKATEATSKVLLISVNTNSSIIQIESFEQVFKIKLFDSGMNINHLGWTLIKITQVDSKTLTVQCGGSSITTIKLINSLAVPKLYLYMGGEDNLGLLPFNGLYAFDATTMFKDTPAIQPSDPSLWINQGFSQKLAAVQKLGYTQTFVIDSDGDKIITNFSIKFGLRITGNYIVKKQILRMTLNDQIFDERKLGYCLACVYVVNQDVIFESYSYELTNSIYALQKKTIVYSSVLQDKDKIYEFVMQNDGQIFSVTDGVQQQQTPAQHIPILSFALIHGGDFLSDTEFTGYLTNLIINYGKDTILTGKIEEFKTCLTELCSNCQIDSLSTCLTCLVSDSDMHKEPNQCSCQGTYFFDINQKCSQCHSTCKLCSGALEDDCIECPLTRTLFRQNFLNKGLCLCSEKYFNDGNSCQSCHESCLTCLGTGINDCISCPYGRIVDSSGQCVCQSNFFVENNQCKPCKAECNTCNNSDSCSTCRENEFINQQTLLCQCNSGYYRDDQQICQKCTEYCIHCSGPGLKQCTQCDNRFHLSTPEKGVGSCVHNLYVKTIEFTKSYFSDNKVIIQNCMLGVVIIDALANIYANKFEFSRVFRMQQFILKIFYLKLVDTDFLESNYQLINSLSFYNGITQLYSLINPFANIKTPPSAQVRNKILLEEIPSSILESCGGVIFIQILLFTLVLFLTLIVKQRNHSQIRDKSSSFMSNPIDNSMRIDRPLNSGRHDFEENEQKSDDQNNNDSNNIQNNEDRSKNLDSIQKLNNFTQQIFWHFNDYAINVCCFGCVLHLIGSSQDPEDVRGDNFLCYFIMIYIILICAVLRSFIIHKPKQKQDYKIYKQQAIQTMRILNERDEMVEKRRMNKINQIQINASGQGDEHDDSEYTNVLQNGSSPIISDLQRQRHSNDERNQSLSSGSGSEKSLNNEEEKKKLVEKPNYRKWDNLLYLHDSICMQGLFECLHMEFIPIYKGCKFYFWVYILNYFCIAASIIGPHDNSSSQYIGLCLLQLIFLILSLFLPYKDILESIKNIIDNVIFFIVVILQLFLSFAIADDIHDFRLTGSTEGELNRYSWASFSLLLIAMIAFMAISIVQVVLRRKNASAQNSTENVPNQNHNQNNILNDSNQLSPQSNLNQEDKIQAQQNKAYADKFKNIRNKGLAASPIQVSPLQGSQLVQNQLARNKGFYANQSMPIFDLNDTSSTLWPAQIQADSKFQKSLKRDQMANNPSQTNQTANTNNSINQNLQQNSIRKGGVGMTGLFNEYNTQINYNQNLIQDLSQNRPYYKSEKRKTQQNHQSIEMQQFSQDNQNSSNEFEASMNQKLQNPEENENNVDFNHITSETNKIGSVFDEDLNRSIHERNLLTAQRSSFQLDYDSISPSQQFNINHQQYQL